MHISYKKISLFVCAFVFSIVLTGCAEKVELSSGEYVVEETTSISAVVTAEDIALIDGLTMLRNADFSGSDCIEEIVSWAERHPEVDVKYTVALPTGEVVENSVVELNLSGMDAQTLIDFAAQLKYLPEVKKITLGDASTLSTEAFNALKAVRDSLELDYMLTLGSKQLSPDTDKFDFSGISSDELAGILHVLSLFEKVEEINLEGAKLNWDDFALLKEVCPEAKFNYSFELYGKPVKLSDTELDFSYQKLDDKGEALRQALPYFSNCTFVNMDSCGISNEDMAALQAQFPDTKIVWRVFFGTNYTLRTDAEKCLASKPSMGGVLYDEDVDVLKYCTDLKYVDVGHNIDLTSMDFVASLPKLEVLVIAMNNITDISALANCPELEYLELNSTQVSDLSPLSKLSKLRHLNIGNCPNVTDISPLYELTELERLWIGCIDPVPEEQVAEMQKNAPACDINTTTYDPTEGGWRVTGYTELSLLLYAETGWLQEVLHPRYELLREQFGYVEQDYSFPYKDPTFKGYVY